VKKLFWAQSGNNGCSAPNTIQTKIIQMDIKPKWIGLILFGLYGKSYTFKHITVPYIPPSSSFDLYKAHVDNIAHLYQELEDGQYICVLGDFNLSSLVWAHDLESSAIVPSNLHLPHEIIVIDELLSMGLVQITMYLIT